MLKCPWIQHLFLHGSVVGHGRWSNSDWHFPAGFLPLSAGPYGHDTYYLTRDLFCAEGVQPHIHCVKKQLNRKKQGAQMKYKSMEKQPVLCREILEVAGDKDTSFLIILFFQKKHF